MTTATLLGLCLLALVGLIWTIETAVKDGVRHLSKVTSQLDRITDQLDDIFHQNGRIIWILRGEEDAFDEILNKAAAKEKVADPGRDE
jgi:hypothetical protein